MLIVRLLPTHEAEDGDGVGALVSLGVGLCVLSFGAFAIAGNYLLVFSLGQTGP